MNDWGVQDLVKEAAAAVVKPGTEVELEEVTELLQSHKTFSARETAFHEWAKKSGFLR